MLTLFGRPHARGGFCDGVNRRDFLTAGGTLLGGCLALPNLLAAEAQSGIKSSHKAIINVYLPGGPPHIDMWDLKPDAPKEIRGELLMIFGTKDPHVPDAGRETIDAALRSSGAHYKTSLYQAEHAFTRDEGPRFDPEATDESFAEMIQIFRNVYRD